MEKRRVPQLTFAEHPDQGRKCWIALSGCNFDCKACISTAKQGVGRAFSPEELVNLVVKSSQFIYDVEMVDRVVFTGGEPLLNIDYLLFLTSKFKDLGVKNFEISTNGSLINEYLLNNLSLIEADILFKLDVKAYSNDIHREYTGKDNDSVLEAVRLLSKYFSKFHKKGFHFMVRTVYIPGIIEIDEIEKIARFIKEVDKDVCYRIEQFSPVHGKGIFRRPTFEEMMQAYNIARKYLDNVVLTTYLPTRPEYNYIEVRADELMETFKEIDKKSKTVYESWNVKYYTMNQILTKNRPSEDRRYKTAEV